MVDLEKSPLKVGQADDEYLDPPHEDQSKAKEEEEDDDDDDEDYEETEEDEEEEDEDEEEEEEAEAEAAAEEGKPRPGWFSQLVAAATYAMLIIIKFARRTKALFG